MGSSKDKIFSCVSMFAQTSIIWKKSCLILCQFNSNLEHIRRILYKVLDSIKVKSYLYLLGLINETSSMLARIPLAISSPLKLSGAF